jgi:pyruvate/2-oxoacid:ferredoxin oxidoreductase alpha subunit
MERLLKKFKTAADLVPQPVLRLSDESTRYGVIYYGSTSPAMREALDVLEEEGVPRGRAAPAAFPFPKVGARLHRCARPRVRGGTEPRRPDAQPAHQ